MRVNVNLVCVRLPWLFQPLLGADVKQLVPEAGDSSVRAVLHFARAGCVLLLPRHSPIPCLSFCLGGGVFPFVCEHSHFLTSFRNAECFRVYGNVVSQLRLQQALPSLRLYLCRAWASQSHSCWMLMSAVFQAEPPHPPGSYRQMEGLGLKPGQEDKARDGKVGTTNEFQRNNSCKKPEEATGKARAAIYGRGLERR